MADMHSDNNGQRADPAGDYSDMQWFMFRQGNVAHYAAFSSRSYDAAALAGLARELIRLAPQLARTPGGEIRFRHSTRQRCAG